jgi:hypothetical protein
MSTPPQIRVVPQPARLEYGTFAPESWDVTRRTATEYCCEILCGEFARLPGTEAGMVAVLSCITDLKAKTAAALRPILNVKRRPSLLIKSNRRPAWADLQFCISAQLIYQNQLHPLRRGAGHLGFNFSRIIISLAMDPAKRKNCTHVVMCLPPRASKDVLCTATCSRASSSTWRVHKIRLSHGVLDLPTFDTFG